MDVQSAVPAFLLLGSAVVTVIVKMNEDQSGKNRWLIGFSLAIISAVSTFIISQTGSPGSVVSEDQYMLAMLITTVFLLVYYVCTGGSGVAGLNPLVNSGNNMPMTATLAACPPPISPKTCCGGDIRNQMINTSCPPPIAPPDPYPPCIDNIYNEGCYSKPYIPEGAVPCVNTDERRMKIRWDRRIDCPKHREMILKGEYPWAPGTPNWQNRTYVDENSRLWYGPDTSYAPMRDNNRNIIGRPLPKPKNTWGRGAKLNAVPDEVGAGSAGPVPYMDNGQPGGNQQPGQSNPIKLRKKKKAKQEFFWGQPPPKPTRFRAPDINYVPGEYATPDFNNAQSSKLASIPKGGFAQGNAPSGFCFAKLPNERSDGQDQGGNAVSATNWRIIMTCALVLLFHRCYKNVINLANAHAGRGSRNVDPFKLVGENPGVLAEAIKQDASMMVVLLSVACVIMFASMKKQGSSSGNQRAFQPTNAAYPISMRNG